MQRIHGIFLTLVLVLTAVPVARLMAWKGAGEIVPMIESVSPAQAVGGDMVTASGFLLDARHVQELYVSGPDVGSRVYRQTEIVMQSDRDILFRVPANAAPGYLWIAIRLVGQAELIEQPVLLKIVLPVS